MRQPQKVKRLGLFSPCLGRKLRPWTKLHDLGLLNRHLKAELGKPPLQFRPKPLRFALVMKAYHEVVGIPDETSPTIARPGKRPSTP